MADRFGHSHLKKDWTKQPIGSARPVLSYLCNRVTAMVAVDAPAHLIEERLKMVELAIKAFRDNER